MNSPPNPQSWGKRRGGRDGNELPYWTTKPTFVGWGETYILFRPQDDQPKAMQTDG